MTKAAAKAKAAAPRAASAGGSTIAARERTARRAIGGGAALLVAGLAMVGVGPSEPGMVLTLVALLALTYGIHTFGRLGPEEPRADTADA
jgi:hypothetical protein